MKSFSDTEIKNFRRLAKVYNYKNILVEKNLFESEDTTDTSKVFQMKIILKQITGTDERQLGNIARICKAKRITYADKQRLVVTYTKN